MSLSASISGDDPPEIVLTTPIFLSTVAILLLAPAFNNLLDNNFSSANTTPSLHLMPIAVPPFSTALIAYSTYFRQSLQPVEAF